MKVCTWHDTLLSTCPAYIFSHYNGRIFFFYGRQTYTTEKANVVRISPFLNILLGRISFERSTIFNGFNTARLQPGFTVSTSSTLGPGHMPHYERLCSGLRNSKPKEKNQWFMLQITFSFKYQPEISHKKTITHSEFCLKLAIYKSTIITINLN